VSAFRINGKPFFPLPIIIIFEFCELAKFSVALMPCHFKKCSLSKSEFFLKFDEEMILI